MAEFSTSWPFCPADPEETTGCLHAEEGGLGQTVEGEHHARAGGYF